MDVHGETIAAIATPVGRGGIGIIKISGPDALAIAKRLFVPARPSAEIAARRLYLGHVIDTETGRVLDQVLLSYMKAPFSYTGEDVVELNSHSGHLILTSIMQILLNQGARLAEPGEFTFRAFMNGKMDLAQAEAVIDLIEARSEKGLQIASSHLAGAFSREIEAIRVSVMGILARVEAAIDFPEEEEVELKTDEIGEDLERAVIYPLISLIECGEENRLSIAGALTAIVGRSNTGKSSLFNRLLKQQRAIVTPDPGTTRDMIESEIILDGLPIRLMDTAGIRVSFDKAEQKGIEITEGTILDADLLILVFDGSVPVQEEDVDILERCRGRRLIAVLNKSDLPPVLGKNHIQELIPDATCVEVSALTGHGIEELRSAVIRDFKSRRNDVAYGHLAPNLRQTKALRSALQACERAGSELQKGSPAEITAFELRGAIEHLGEITGQGIGNDLLDEIFSRFCIGK